MAIDILTALTEKPQNLDFVLPGLVTGTVGAIVSPGGSGKSALALQLCAEIAGGPNLLEIGDIKKGLSVYLPGEDPELAVRHRVFALGENCNKEQRAQLAEQLLIIPLESHNPNIMQQKWYDYIIKIATDRRLLIIDTLRIIHVMEENDSGAMAQVIGVMKKIAATTGCAIVFLHHTSKSSAMNNQGAEQQASRGSSVLVDNIRWQGYLKNMSEKEAKEFGISDNQQRFFVQFGVSKQNFGLPFKPLWLKKVSCNDKEITGGFTLQKAILERKKGGGL